MRGTRTYCSSACSLSYAQANRHLQHTITAMEIWASPSRLTYAAENSHQHHQTLDIHAFRVFKIPQLPLKHPAACYNSQNWLRKTLHLRLTTIHAQLHMIEFLLRVVDQILQCDVVGLQLADLVVLPRCWRFFHLSFFIFLSLTTRWLRNDIGTSPVLERLTGELQKETNQAKLSSLFPRAHTGSQKNILPTVAIPLSKSGKATFQPAELYTTNEEAHNQSERKPSFRRRHKMFKIVPSLQARPLN